MSKYVVINTDGTNAFYDSDINTEIPSNAFKISDSDYETFFSNQGYYIFIEGATVATLLALTDVYVASVYGTVITKQKSNVSIPTGSVSFTSEPTTEELETAFPCYSTYVNKPTSFTSSDTTPITVKLTSDCFTWDSTNLKWVLDKETAITYLNTQCSVSITSKEKYYAAIMTSSLYSDTEIATVLVQTKADKLALVQNNIANIEVILNG